MNKDDLTELGFKDVDYFTIMDSIIYDLGRRRLLSIGCLGTPNETMFLCEKSKDGDHYTDLVCVHNLDYDGKLTKDKVEYLIKYFETDWSSNK